MYSVLYNTIMIIPIFKWGGGGEGNCRKIRNCDKIEYNRNDIRVYQQFSLTSFAEH